MSRASQAREQIKAAMRGAGGVYAVATASGVHFTQIYRFLRGGGLDPQNAGALRSALPALDPTVWADAFAPVDEQAEVAP